MTTTVQYPGTQAGEVAAPGKAGRWWWLAAPGVALVAMLLFGLTRFGNFQGEDFTLLNQLRGPKRTIGDTLGFFGSDWGLEGKSYAPLPRLLFYLEYRFFVINPVGWHLFSAALHATCSALVWGVAWRLSRRPVLALSAGLFFAIMPVHVAVVAQPSYQAEMLAAIFCLASAIAFLNARQRPEVASLGYILAIAFYLLALLCKQTALALPVALLAYEFVTGGLDRILGLHNDPENEQADNLTRLAAYHSPFWVLLILYLGLNFAVLGGLDAFAYPAPRPGISEFLRGNLRLLTNPFGLGGTDGLILLAALGAFMALTAVQEWEIWRFNYGLALKSASKSRTRRRRIHDPEDEEMEDFYKLDTSPIEPVSSPPVVPFASEEAVPLETTPSVTSPYYWTLRLIGYGFLWCVAFLIPFILVQPNARSLYLPSVGFALFLAAVLAPFGASSLRPEVRPVAGGLFGWREISFWLRLAAILAILFSGFATSVTAIDAWNGLSKVFEG